MVENSEIFYTGSMFDTLNQAAQAGGQVLRKYFRRKLVVATKTGPTDLVTRADTESQQAVVDSLQKSMKEKGYADEEIGFIGEENALARVATHTFIIDPLDGTSSYAAGRDTFAISIAYMKGEVVQASLVYEPVYDVVHFASHGQGAWKIFDGKKERMIIQETPLAQSTVAFNVSFSREVNLQIFNSALRLVPHILQIHEFHSAVTTMMRMVENEFQAFYNGGCKIWDIAATKLILEEAGGEMVDWSGKQIVYNLQETNHWYQFLAAHPKLLQKLLIYVG